MPGGEAGASRTPSGDVASHRRALFEPKTPRGALSRRVEHRLDRFVTERPVDECGDIQRPLAPEIRRSHRRPSLGGLVLVYVRTAHLSPPGHGSAEDSVCLLAKRN